MYVEQISISCAAANSEATHANTSSRIPKKDSDQEIYV